MPIIGQIKKILLISSRLPYPPIGGDRLKNYWLLKILSKHYKVHLISITDNDVPDEFNKWASEIGLTYRIFRKSKRSFYINSLRYFINDLPLQVNYYYFKDIKDYIKSIYKDYNLLFATLVRTAEYFIDIKDRPRVIDIVDSIGINYKRSIEKTYSLKWKVIYKIEANRLLQYESRCVDNFNMSFFVNRTEMEFFNNPDKTAWLPNGANEALLHYECFDKRYSNSIVFFGKMDYQPNIDAVLWFAKNVMPLIEPSIEFLIVGANPTKSVLRLGKIYPNVKVMGYVDDPYRIINSALCVVAPMQTGGGIQNKILESMALGSINIVSSLAAEPIGAEHGRHFLVADSPKDIAHYINDIYRNPKKYEYIKSNSKNYMKENFTWSVYEKRMLELIERVLNRYTRGR